MCRYVLYERRAVLLFVKSKGDYIKYKITMIYLSGHSKGVEQVCATNTKFDLKTYQGVFGSYKIVKIELNKRIK